MSSSSTPPQIDLLVLDDVKDSILETLKSHFIVHIYKDEESLKPIASKIRAVATTGGMGMMRPDLMASLPNLEIISVNGVGTDRINLEEAAKRNIAITIATNVSTNDVADTAMMLLLNLKRHFRFNEDYLYEGKWSREGYPPLAHSLEKCRLGVVGFGHIGQAIARRATASEMEVAYYNRRPRSETSYKYIPDLIELASWSDILVLAVPGCAETDKMIDASILKALGPQGVLINIARGSVVDEEALIKALEDGTIAGAGLDVFCNEPHINPAFLKLKNVTLQPHQGSATEETRQNLGQNMIDNLLAHFSGKKLLTPLT
ncbi:2-hydroxyacid dehydrogenase [Aristophania vespae]|uniref:2-hydroxyacid dehydrogenase n=1 Tax=Aristophania vespae TaxID=2697033 RepID=UPI002351A5AA|nr:2-hydroxyacid dehydrogenase [Aristophania vespae]UMM63664.1 2-ketogluconate reductase [Aristophania vespae]